jgi:hypothetical protein
MDPYERAESVSDQYYDWAITNGYLIAQAQLRAMQFLETFKEYPPSQKPASFSIDQIRADVDKAIEASFHKRER